MHGLSNFYVCMHTVLTVCLHSPEAAGRNAAITAALSGTDVPALVDVGSRGCASSPSAFSSRDGIPLSEDQFLKSANDAQCLSNIANFECLSGRTVCCTWRQK